jgi:hypothetical protein
MELGLRAAMELRPRADHDHADKFDDHSSDMPHRFT